jgi:RNA polymerase sigma factor (sigma-70 family)
VTLATDIAACFEAHRARVYRWAYGLCRRHDDSADVVQETFSRLLEKRPALPNEAATAAWLRRVAERIVVDRWRRRAARESIARSAAGGATDAAQPDDETRAAVRDALHSLSTQQRLVIMAKFYDDLKFEQIATELGISVPTAKTHYLRALAALRGRLALVRV